MKAIPAIVLFACAFNSCRDKQDAAFQTAPVHVQSVNMPSTVPFGQPISFELTCSTPTPCWEFDRFEIQQDGFSYAIQVLARYDGRPCVQVLGSFTTTGSVTPTERGAYTLRFWRAQAPTLDATVTVQ